jgi:beta-galactosidase
LKHLDALARLQPHQPLMVSEFWTGWFDHWGEKHHTVPTELVVAGLRAILSRGASFNLYMFHGGTTFGWYQGANLDPKYLPDVTSYDYDALLNEHGGFTEKYKAIQALLRAQFPDPTANELPPVDLVVPLALPEVRVSDVLDLLALVDGPRPPLEGQQRCGATLPWGLGPTAEMQVVHACVGVPQCTMIFRW